jgi:hypothetical protein
MQNMYRLNHNDAHYGNVLMDTKIKAGGYFVYKITQTDNTVTSYYIKNNGCIPKLWDFEFAMVYSDKIPGTFGNQFVIGPLEFDNKSYRTIEEYSTPSEEYNYTVPVQFSEIYDSHYFLCSLLDLVISKELFEWINTVFPESVIPPSEYSSVDDSCSISSSSDLSCSSFYSTSASSSENIIRNLSIKDPSNESNESNESDASSYTSSIQYVERGRLVNGRTENLNIKSTFELLNSGFFDDFKTVPEDYLQSESITFEYRVKSYIV